ncbi:hypothetical protein CP533_6341 [Ophiocordyceps camponoti-saundersi (nom. inval.)]|nr:hypothetical protein CP533_6341 [Ophiocordyceps camponoti-saundersi (nom. inval.)]
MLATHLNKLYSILTPTQPCLPEQKACVDGKIARCKDGAFELEACAQKEERTGLDALKVLGKDALPKKLVEGAGKAQTRSMVTLTTVVTVTDSSSSASYQTQSSPSSKQPSSSSSCTHKDHHTATPTPSSSKAPTGKPGFISVTGPIAGPTPTITTPYLYPTPTPSVQAPAPKPPALMVLPLDGLSAQGKAAVVAPKEDDEAGPRRVYMTVTVTETEKERDTVTVTVTTIPTMASK